MNFILLGLGSRSLRASCTLVALALAIAAVLAAGHILEKEAQFDLVLMQERSEGIDGDSPPQPNVAAATSSVSSIESSQASLLTNQANSLSRPSATTDAPLSPGQDPIIESIRGNELGDSDDATCTAEVPGVPYCVHVVQEGETLSTIAEASGLLGTPNFSATELLALSNGVSGAQGQLILVGQELRIPVESGLIHTVQPAETVSGLAERYGVLSEDLIAANGITDANGVLVGETLLIPSPTIGPVSGSVADTEEGTEAGESEALPAEAEAEVTPDIETDSDSAGSAVTADAEVALDVEVSAAPSLVQPEASNDVAPGNANSTVAEIRAEFAAGYISAGGPEQYLDHLMESVIPCESGYDELAFNPVGPYYGLLQFNSQTWANNGGGDWFDAWQQGANTGRLLQSYIPAMQWPSCW